MVGCDFRLHGRDPATGLDCVGLVAAALTACGRQPAPPQGYGLRNVNIDDWLPQALRSGLEPAEGAILAGDVLLIALGFAQHHIVIASDADSVVHAHAGLRRVVLQPRDPAWQVRAMWRIAPLTQG
jgi:hypothetical protein